MTASVFKTDAKKSVRGFTQNVYETIECYPIRKIQIIKMNYKQVFNNRVRVSIVFILQNYEISYRIRPPRLHH